MQVYILPVCSAIGVTATRPSTASTQNFRMILTVGGLPPPGRLGGRSEVTSKPALPAVAFWMSAIVVRLASIEATICVASSSAAPTMAAAAARLARLLPCSDAAVSDAEAAAVCLTCWGLDADTGHCSCPEHTGHTRSHSAAVPLTGG